MAGAASLRRGSAISTASPAAWRLRRWRRRSRRAGCMRVRCRAAEGSLRKRGRAEVDPTFVLK